MAKLSTHVLDTMHGRPAAGVQITLFRADGEAWTQLVQTRTNADGRTDQALLSGDAVVRGRYRLVFDIGAYFRALPDGAALPEPMFLDQVPIEFGISEAGGNYHVPLVCSPWAFSSYRGS